MFNNLSICCFVVVVLCSVVVCRLGDYGIGYFAERVILRLSEGVIW